MIKSMQKEPIFSLKTLKENKKEARRKIFKVRSMPNYLSFT